jgi:hypothetical protein
LLLPGFQEHGVLFQATLVCGIDQMQKVPYLNILPQTSEKCGFVMLTENTIVAMEKDSVDIEYSLQLLPLH